MPRTFSAFAGLCAVVALVLVGSSVASAAVVTSNSTTYDGSDADADQAIEVSYTVSPDGSMINNMTVDFSRTGQSFVASDSFSFTVNPGGADIDVQSRPGNAFFIPELGPNEEVTFTFEVYPRTIKQEETDAVSVQMDYVQNGQDLTDSETVTADTSSSPWFELQQAEQTVAEQEEELSQLGLVGQLTNGAFLLGVGVGVVGLAVGGFAWRKRGRDLAAQADEHAAEIESLAKRMESPSDENRVERKAEDIREGDTGTGPDDWD